MSDITENLPLVREDVLAELHRLRTLASSDADAVSTARKAAEASQQDRQRKFLEQSWAQAQLLLQDENLELLAELLDEKGMSIDDSFSKRCEQVASLQIGYENNDGEWKTTARREVRIGQLYTIFAKKEWPADGLAAKLTAEGGTTKILEAARELSPGEKAKLIRARKAMMNDREAEVIATDAYATKEPEWRLALVSTHRGELRIHSLVDKKGAGLDSIVDAHVKVREKEMAEAAAQAQESGE